MERRGSQPEGNRPKEATLEQLAAAKVDFFLGMQTSLKGVAKDYVKTKEKAEGLLGKKKRKKRRRNVTSALMDLYLIKERGLPDEDFREQVGEEASIFESLLAPQIPVLKEREKEYTQKAADYTTKKLLGVALGATYRLKGLSDTQREKLFEAAGYSPKESWEIVRKLATAFVATGVLGGSSALAIGAASTYERVSPVVPLGDMSNRTTQIIVGASYLAHYIAAYGNARRSEEH